MSRVIKLGYETVERSKYKAKDKLIFIRENSMIPHLANLCSAMTLQVSLFHKTDALVTISENVYPNGTILDSNAFMLTLVIVNVRRRSVGLDIHTRAISIFYRNAR